MSDHFMVQRIRDAMVSLHSHVTDDAPAHFVCSGVLVAPAVVLTVRHVFDNFQSDGLWVRPQVNRSPALAIQGQVHFHPSLDAAWFSLASHPPHALTLQLDHSKGYEPAADYDLYAYFENALNEALRRRVTAFTDTWQRYSTEPLHQCGMSGGALCRNGALWGLLFARYDDLSANRGCVVAMHQLWEGFLDQIPGVAAPFAATSRRDAESTWSHAAVVISLREAVKAVLSVPPLCNWPWPQPVVDGIPQRLSELLNSAERERGAQVVDWIVDLADAINQAMDYATLTLDRAAKKRTRDGLMRAMGMASRLCLDPVQLAALQGLEQRLEVSAATTEGALVAAREQPHQGWLVTRHDKDAPAVKDRYACSWIEHGEGNDKNYGILSAIASMPSRENPTGERITVSASNEKRWRAFLTDERQRGRGRCLILSKDYRDALGTDTEIWLQRFGIAVVVLLGDVSGLFWLEEDLLLGRIQGFLRGFEESDHWKTPDAP
ncbi:MAG: hypothetical protein JNN30_17695 [Rhodanobacteraceae bacterium]|nr:hypothetical protein [Rhodanobacteraceae bacterium]